MDHPGGIQAHEPIFIVLPEAPGERRQHVGRGAENLHGSPGPFVKNTVL
jgi:hypothetical protein